MGGACEARRGAVCPESGEATSRRPEAIRRLRMFSPAREQCDFIGHFYIIDLYHITTMEYHTEMPQFLDLVPFARRSARP